MAGAMPALNRSAFCMVGRNAVVVIAAGIVAKAACVLIGELVPYALIFADADAAVKGNRIGELILLIVIGAPDKRAVVLGDEKVKAEPAKVNEVFVGTHDKPPCFIVGVVGERNVFHATGARDGICQFLDKIAMS